MTVSAVQCRHSLQQEGDGRGEAAPTRPKGKSKRAGVGAISFGGSNGVTGGEGGAGGFDRYVSSFDFFSDALRPEKRLHDRLLSCLARKGAKERNVDMVTFLRGDHLEGDDGETINRGRQFGGTEPGHLREAVWSHRGLAMTSTRRR